MKNKYLLMLLFLIIIAIFIVVKNNGINSDNEIILGDSNVTGDVDGNGKVEVKDYILIRKHILKQITLTGAQKTRADVDGKSGITAGDYIVIRKIIMGLITPTPTTSTTPPPTDTVSNNYVITFDANGGTVSTSSKKVKKGSEYGTLPTPTRSGYAFVGWFTSKTSGFDAKYYADNNSDLKKAFGYNYDNLLNHWMHYSATEPRLCSADNRRHFSKYTKDGNETLYAMWVKKDYTITFDANGGSVSTTSKAAKIGEKYGTLPTPTRSGYKFVGWFTSKEAGFDAKYYADNNSDLKKAFGYDYDKLLNHWFNFGLTKENRQCSSFNRKDYIKYDRYGNETLYAIWLMNETSTTPAPNLAKIHFLKTGDSDAIIVESGGHYGMIDAGLNSGTPLNYLNELGVNYLDFVILTHSHPDHYGGMIDVANKYVNSKTTFYYRKASNQISSDQQFYNAQDNVIDTMKKRGASMQEVTDKTPTFSMGDFKFELMNTAKASSDEKNAAGQITGMNKESIVTYVTYNGKYGTLLTGDIESQDEARLASTLSDKKIKIDVLKIAHHSWQSSTTMKFTKAVSPKIAIVTGKYLLDDISATAYYMQQKYGTKFYVTEKSDGAVIVDYANNLSVSPDKAKESNLSVVEDKNVNYKESGWRKLSNGIWIHLSNKDDPTSIEYSKWYQSGGKWYYFDLHGNMMTGWIEVNYNGTPALYYLGKDGARLTGWQKATSYGPFNNDKSSYYSTWMYSHVNGTVDGWYQYSDTWANGKNWFYFDPSTGVMLRNVTKKINNKEYSFNASGICTKGC